MLHGLHLLLLQLQIMRIIQNVRPDRQTVMFSATFPKSVETLARKVGFAVPPRTPPCSAPGLQFVPAPGHGWGFQGTAQAEWHFHPAYGHILQSLHT